jgi:hypothetical protein
VHGTRHTQNAGLGRHFPMVAHEGGVEPCKPGRPDYIHLVLNSTLYIFVSRKGCPSVVEILSRPFSQACGVRPFIHANSEGCRGRNTIRPPSLAGFDPMQKDANNHAKGLLQKGAL